MKPTRHRSRKLAFALAIAAGISLPVSAFALHGDWPDWCDKQDDPPLKCWIIAL